MKDKTFLLELLAIFLVMFSGVVPLRSQVPPSLAVSKEISAESLAKEFRQLLKEASYLEVSVSYEATYANLSLTGKDCERNPTKAIEAIRSDISRRDSLVVIRATALSKMEPDCFEATFWREDQMEKYPDGLTKLRLLPSSSSPGVEMPTLHEWHCYPLLDGKVRENSFVTNNPHGAEDPSLPNPLFAEIPGACSSAELWFTWLGESSQAQSFEGIISQGQLIGQEKFDEEKDAYRVERTVYKDDEEDGFFYYHQVFWLDCESGFLIGWRQERASLVYGKAANYLVVTISYDYPEVAKVATSQPPVRPSVQARIPTLSPLNKE